jgi:hypothetical protein
LRPKRSKSLGFSPTGSWISNRVRRCVAEFDRRTISGTRVERYNLLAPAASLRLGSRIVPRTPSSLGKKLAICACSGLSFSAIGVYPRFLPDLSAYLSIPRCKNPSRCFHVPKRLCGDRIAPCAADTADGRTNNASPGGCRRTTRTCWATRTFRCSYGEIMKIGDAIVVHRGHGFTRFGIATSSIISIICGKLGVSLKRTRYPCWRCSSAARAGDAKA